MKRSKLEKGEMKNGQSEEKREYRKFAEGDKKFKERHNSKCNKGSEWYLQGKTPTELCFQVVNRNEKKASGSNESIKGKLKQRRVRKGPRFQLQETQEHGSFSHVVLNLESRGVQERVLTSSSVFKESC